MDVYERKRIFLLLSCPIRTKVELPPNVVHATFLAGVRAVSVFKLYSDRFTGVFQTFHFEKQWFISPVNQINNEKLTSLASRNRASLSFILLLRPLDPSLKLLRGELFFLLFYSVDSFDFNSDLFRSQVLDPLISPC